MNYIEDDLMLEYGLHFIDRYHSPNFNNRVSSIVLHNTATNSFDDTMKIFMNPQRAVSSHFVVDINGDVYNMVEESKRAWHAGVSEWKNRVDLNSSSIGIEIQNSGDQTFTDVQNNAVITLCKYLIKKYEVAPGNIVGHGDIAPGRKHDPSAYFDWKELYDGLDVFHDLFNTQLIKEEQSRVIVESDNPDSRGELLRVQQNLEKYGYAIRVNGEYDQLTKDVFRAFNRHFTYDSIFTKENIQNHRVISDPNNCRWYAISDERLNKLLLLI